jgi:hypothetical protein
VGNGNDPGGAAKHQPGSSDFTGQAGREFRAVIASADDGFERIPQLGRFIGVQLDDEATTAFQRNPHHDPPALFGDLERTIARPRLHRRHASTPFLIGTAIIG